MDTSILLIAMLGLFSIANVEFCLGNGDSNSNTVCSQKERQALLNLKQGLKDPSNLLSTWSSSEDCCTWVSVDCDNTTGHVIGLSLSYDKERSKLGGTISPSLLELKFLNYLDLSLNDFGGIRIAAFLGSLDNLRYLNLTKAGFSGTIPHQLGNLSSLRYLDLSLNVDSVELDVENLQWLSHLSSLRYLGMRSVNLKKASDHWLQVINMLPSLLELHLSSCSLNHIHSFPYVNFTSLVVLDLSANHFGVHSMPNWLFSLTDLVSLKLSSNEFQGPLPVVLQNLTKLRTLDLSDNKFNSTIPNWFYNFRSLEFIDLSYNDLQGIISVDIGNLTSIVNLDLSYCNLEGGIPRTMGHLCNLRRLKLSRNKLRGEILGFLSGCMAYSLTYLDLENNQLSGPLMPDQTLGLKNLEYLLLHNNSFSGPIPKSLGSLSKLEILYISDNPFEGVVSEIHLANLTRLQALDMDSTSLLTLNLRSDWIPPFQLDSFRIRSVKLTTQFPAWLRTQKGLLELDLSNSGISDTIPTWFWNMSSQFFYLNLSHNNIRGELPMFLKSDALSSTFYLQSNQFEGPLPPISPKIIELDLSNNSISGPISNFLCDMVNGTNQLELLDLSENFLSGDLPDCWMNWPFLKFINLGTNNLKGNIPNSMGSQLQLKSLHLRSNNLLGKLPSSLQNCTLLMTVDLSENGLFGDIPTWIGNSLPNLLVLSLRLNKFNGGIPPELCHLTSLQILDLAHNNLSGIIPQCFGNLSAMVSQQSSLKSIFYSIYAGNYIEKALLVMKGMQLEYSKTLTLVKGMDLSSNSLSGEIPEELTNLLGLISLNLSENYLTGRIPEKIGVMGLLQSLDFSVNKLSGVIPLSMAKLNYLELLNLSYNNFSGKIPSSTQLQSFSESSYMGNQGLCGPPLMVDCTQSKGPNDGDVVQEEDSGGFDRESFYISMAMGIIVGFWTVIGVLIFKKTWRFTYFLFIDEVKDKLCTCFTSR